MENMLHGPNSHGGAAEARMDRLEGENGPEVEFLEYGTEELNTASSFTLGRESLLASLLLGDNVTNAIW